MKRQLIFLFNLNCCLMLWKVMSFAAPNYVPYRACLAIINNARVLSHINTRLMHEGSSIRRITRGSKGHDFYGAIACKSMRIRENYNA